jgi:hypothetical protein
MPVEIPMNDFTTEELREFLAILPPHNPLLETLLTEVQRRRREPSARHSYNLRPKRLAFYPLPRNAP